MSGKFLTGVVAAVVVPVAAGGLDACIAELLAEVGNGNLKFGEVLKGNEELEVGGSVVNGKCNVGRSEICNQGVITGSVRY